MPFYKEGMLPPPQTLQQAYQNALTRIQQYGNQWTQYGDTMRGLTGIMDKWSRGEATPEERGYAVGTAIQNMSVPAPIAYHGTPHEWAGNKPDISKVGTGQGAQSYGHGLYFAENKEVAKSYAKEFSEGNPLLTVRDKAGKIIAQGDSITNEMLEQITQAEKSARLNIGYGAKQGGLATGPIRVGEWAVKYEKPTGKMYQVNIPDEHVAKMLDWDKPLSEQAPEVKNILISAGLMRDKSKFSDTQIYARAKQYFEGPRSMAHVNEDIGMAERVREGYRVFQQGPQAFRKWIEMQPSGSSVVEGMIGPGPAAEYMAPSQLYSKMAATPAEASAKLKSLGIPGIKYLDQRSRQAGQGSRNFVVFDPEIVKDVMKQ